MAWFTVETRYIADRDRLQKARPGHRAYLSGLAERGLVLAGGPFADDRSGFAVYRVADRAELDRLLAEDPYTIEGIAAERVVGEWRITVGPWADPQ